MFFSLSFRRASSLVILVGLTTFAFVFGVLMTVAPGWVISVIPAISQTALPAVFAAVVSQIAMSLTGFVLTRRKIGEVEQIRTAIDSMAQGLCMFDASERLVVCNTQYYAMYGLTPADVKPGSTLSEVLAKRVAKGTFSRDPHQYRKGGERDFPLSKHAAKQLSVTCFKACEQPVYARQEGLRMRL